MRAHSRHLRSLFLACALVGLAGFGLSYVHRFLAESLQAAIDGLGQGRARVASVGGNLLEGMILQDVQVDTDVPGETRVSVSLPQVRIRYDLWSILTRRSQAAPSSIELSAPRVEIERRGEKLELYKLVNLLGHMRTYLSGVPVTIAGGKLALGGKFPWKGFETFEVRDGFLEWTGIGLTYRASGGWRAAKVALQGTYDPSTGLGQLRWEGERPFAGDTPFAAAAPVAATTGAGWLSGAAVTGTAVAGGEFLMRTRKLAEPDPVRKFYRFEIDRVGPVELAWAATARMRDAQIAVPALGAPLAVRSLELSWPSGGAGAYSASVAAFGGAIRLEGKLGWPLPGIEGFTARLEEIRLAQVPGLSAAGEARASGELQGGLAFPWPFRLKLAGLRLPHVPVECSAELEGAASPAEVQVSTASLVAGAAKASGQLTLYPTTAAFEARAVLSDLPAEWAGLISGVKRVSGSGIQGTLEAKGKLRPWTLEDGRFAAHAPKLTVSDVSAGDIRAEGRFQDGKIQLDSLAGVSKAQLFSSFRLSGVFQTGKPADVSGVVRGLRLDAFAPGVRGVAEADVKISGGHHEVHARVKDFAIPSADVRIPSVEVELVPRGKAESLVMTLPGKGKLEAAVVWSPGANGSLGAAGSFRLPDVSFLLAPKGFLKGGKASGSFRLALAPRKVADLDFSLLELDLITQRGPLVAQGPITGAIRGKRLVFQPASISLAGGTVGFQGVAGLDDASWDLELSTDNLPVHFESPSGSGALSGRLRSTFQLSGTLVRPTLVADLALEKPSLRGISLAGKDGRQGLDRLRGKMTYRAGELAIERLTIASGKEECAVTGQVPVQFSISPFSASLGRGPMNLSVAFPPSPLSVASLFVPWLPPGSDGTFQAEVTVSGTPAKPKVEGLLVATAAKLNVSGLTAPLTGVTAKLVFNDDRAVLREFQGGFAGGKLTGGGQIVLGDGLRPDCDLSFDLAGLQVSRKNVSLEDVYVKMRVRGGPDKLSLDSSFTFEKGVLDLAFFDGPPGTFFDSIPEWVSYTIGAEAKGVFWVRSSAVNAELQGALKMEGRGPERRIGGELNAVRGALHFQGHRFNVESGTVTFRTPPVSDLGLFPWQAAEAKRPASVPYITARGVQQIGQTTIYMEMSGPAEHMTFNLRSQPVHTEDEILAILATRSDADAGLASKDEVVSRMVTAPIAAKFDDQFLNRPVGSAVRKATGLDEFRIDTNLLRNSERPTAIAPQISAGKYIGKNVFLSVDGRVGTENQSIDHLGVQYQLQKNLAVTLDKNLESKALTEDLMRDIRPEETKVGMEYKLRW